MYRRHNPNNANKEKNFMETMLTLQDVQALLKDERPADVCSKTGLSRHTVYRIRDGEFDDVKYTTVKALSDYFKYD